MNLRLIRGMFLLCLVSLAAVACQAEPRTEYLLEVTREVTVVVVVTATPEGIVQTPQSSTQSSVAVPSPTVVVNTATPQIELAPTVDPRPAPVTEQIIVAEQLFEGGRMFYLQPNQNIWVMVYNNGTDSSAGQWLTFSDTWDATMPELDSSIVPPSEDLYQPERGFGKLWRENTEVRDALGWAIDAEVGHVTAYQYFPGGQVTDSGVYVPGPGTHALNSHYGETYIFDESTQTWGIAAATGN